MAMGGLAFLIPGNGRSRRCGGRIRGADWDRILGLAFPTREVTLVEDLDLEQKGKGWGSLVRFQRVTLLPV